jgi:aldose 1-epimerase
MSAMVRHFGLLADGTGVESITLEGGQGGDGLQLEVLTYGAIIRRLSFPVHGARRELVLHFDRLEDYERDRAYVGPVVGRFGNRIAQGRFSIDGVVHQLTQNEGDNHLHGGALGFSRRPWRVLEVDGHSRLALGLHSPAGEEGYPGNLEAMIEFLVKPDTLRIRLNARCDAPTPVNLTYHPYFNLSGDVHTPATEHWLRIPASHYLPVRAGLIPTGERAPVEGTPFDFRVSRRLAPPPPASHPQLELAGGYDHCWVLDGDADCACELASPRRDLTMVMRGTGPGLQFYNGQFLGRTHPLLGNGVILEPQGLPNAVNEASFPDAILRPGEIYRAQIEYQLRV